MMDGIFGLDNSVPLWQDRDPTDHFDFLMHFSRSHGLAERFSLAIINPRPNSYRDYHIPSDDYFRNIATQVPYPHLEAIDGDRYTRSVSELPIRDWQCRTSSTTNAIGDLAGSATLYEDPLTMKTMEICSGVKRILLAGIGNSAISMERLEITEGMAWQFFCPINLRRFIHLYWELWHHNWPCIHKPSFQCTTALPNLLAAMALIGASISPRSSDRENARIWFDVIEELVFSDQCTGGMAWGGDLPSIFTRDERRRRLQTLQAAYVVCIFQNWEGDNTGQSRTRRSRFNTIIAMTRNLDISKARHRDMRSLAENDFNWEEFIYTEEKIRIILFVYLLDAAFVTWNNHPPRMILCELQMGLAHPESCFQAESSTKCFQNIKYWYSLFPQQQDECFYSVIQTFCRSKMNEVDQFRFAYTALINFWAIVKAFQIMIFHNHVMISSETQFQPVLNGINNWKAVWNRRFVNGDDDIFDVPIAENTAGTARVGMMDIGQHLGFWTHASEYWLLARLILNQMLSSSSNRIEASEDEPAGSLLDLSFFTRRTRAVGGPAEFVLVIEALDASILVAVPLEYDQARLQSHKCLEMDPAEIN
ncbi:hypothetical protein B7463_g11972, partial [Scytalidium lignicola]